MRLSEQGKYSATAQRFSKQICQRIQENYYSNISNAVITDACAGNGGDTIVFSKKFKHVNSIEKDLNEFEYLKGNVKFLKLKNVTLINNSCLKTSLEQDIIYFDPPWGGPNYKNHNVVDLFLDGQNINDIVLQLINKCTVKLIVLKVPHNFGLKEFKKIIPIKPEVYLMTKFKLIIVNMFKF